MPRKKKVKGTVLAHLVTEEDIFESMSNVMNICDSIIDDQVRDETSSVRDLSNLLFTMVVSLEFAYVCYRRRVKLLYDALHERTGAVPRSTDDVNATVDTIRTDLREFMGDVIHEDGESFSRSIEIVPLGELSPEYRINMKGGDA